ncbi:SDR family NAD(P)-dependent oxidoreductase [Legionella quateirensis]|uniref:Oxidoreductase n=1 Tax=Legionella quateirensis TaxID=45072 RepID=A0A378KVV1_9GAMM|nr:SDR family NAD(P)-dependent oxidoreductase [Legionella quateirensis]KTD51266.1 oxidoreductase [Legionella quateirensis]STY17488.1 oxidoreductase [Legionella quateirensis]
MLTILIIGASQGLGLEWVKHYKKQGAAVIATTRNPDAAIELKELLIGDKDKIVQLDVTDKTQVSSVLEQLSEAPDLTIYNAGVKGYTKLPETKVTLLNAALICSESDSREAGRELAFKVNAHGFDQIVFELKDKLLSKPQATVVYVSSGVAETSQNISGGYPFYRQSKTTGDSYARGWDIDLFQNTTLECRPRVFSIVPGLVDTGMGAGIDGAAPPATRIAEMAEVIAHVQLTGDTHGIWKYDGTKLMEYQIPELMKDVTLNKLSYASILAKEGLYKLNDSSDAKESLEPVCGNVLG